MTPTPAPPVRRLTLADLPACLDLAADRGWPPEEHKWRLLLSAGQGYGLDAPPGDGGGLIASAVVTSYAGTCHCVSMVLGAARHAGRGLGRLLMRHVVAECAPATTFLTATDNGRPLYEQLGFKAVGAVTLLRGRFTGDVPGAGTDAAVRPATAADLPDVLALDRPVFGADRTGLLARLPSFADQFLVARAPDGRLAGYAAAWPNLTTTVVGPVCADDTATAQALIARLGSNAPLPLRFDADDRHPDLAAWLRANGLTGTSRFTLMVLNAPDIPGDFTRRFAPYSVALG
ncbi:GNAT family N-acetyltransferase [Streptomyces specialis]|uniref:GNAT family N-acetyltransferase n=1 Tax=Streptomyces specialis TaxID=498367 RepID=UPI00073F7FA6|nr:GNAT family N-acetyltransferase [Streptomyces specialis]